MKGIGDLRFTIERFWICDQEVLGDIFGLFAVGDRIVVSEALRGVW